jgi:hypothetical protein
MLDVSKFTDSELSQISDYLDKNAFVHLGKTALIKDDESFLRIEDSINEYTSRAVDDLVDTFTKGVPDINATELKSRLKNTLYNTKFEDSNMWKTAVGDEFFAAVGEKLKLDIGSIDSVVNKYKSEID